MSESSFAAVAADWMQHLFATSPSDRAAVESALGSLYESTEIPAPSRIIWLDSPRQAALAIGLLNEHFDSVAGEMIASAGTSKKAQAVIDQAREELRPLLGLSSWSAVPDEIGVMDGAMMMQRAGMFAMPGPTSGTSLETAITMKRADLFHGNYAAFSEALPAPIAKIQTAWRAIVGHYGGGVLESSLRTDGVAFATLLNRNLYARYEPAQMAFDEARALLKSRQPSPALEAAWRISKGCSMWWTFQHAVILLNHPCELHRDSQLRPHNETGPAIAYRDGWKIFALKGVAQAAPGQEKQTARRETSTPKAKRTSSAAKASPLLLKALPRDHSERIALLREQGGLPHYERYLKGECVVVWEELVDIGDGIRTSPDLPDALAVAYETMMRVERNVRTIIERLRGFGYRFQTNASVTAASTTQAESILNMDFSSLLSTLTGRSIVPPHIKALSQSLESARGMLGSLVAKQKQAPKSTEEQPIIAPDPNVFKTIQKLEKLAGPIPLSLRAFYDVVGTVSLMGEHPRITGIDVRGVASDPLMVFPCEEAVDELEALLDDRDPDEPLAISISPDELHKANTSGGGPYQIHLPDGNADGELRDESHGITFVEYLRLSLQWGGFPGWETHDAVVPEEIAKLAQGLEPI